MRAVWAALALALAVTAPGAAAAQATILDWRDLDGWAADDHGAALAVFQNTCGDMDGTAWSAL